MYIFIFKYPVGMILYGVILLHIPVSRYKGFKLKTWVFITVLSFEFIYF